MERSLSDAGRTRNDDAEELKPGTLIACRYQVVRQLASGALGALYEAYDQRFGESVALKVSSWAPEEVLRNEAMIGRRLGRTPGFVLTLDWGPLAPEGHYIATDLIATPAKALDLELESGGIEERVERVRQAADLVARMHERGVIHRDVKPSNFLVGADGRLWLTDFSLGRILGQADTVGNGSGTAAFMPPEQQWAAQSVTTSGDVYSLGVMLHLAIAGWLPDLYPQPPRLELEPGMDPDLVALCARALSHDPTARPTASGLSQALRDWTNRFVVAEARLLDLERRAPPAASPVCAEIRALIDVARVNRSNALVNARRVLELVARDVFVRERPDHRKTLLLFDVIQELLTVFPEPVATYMDALRRFGNIGAHAKKPISLGRTDMEVVLGMTLGVAEWYATDYLAGTRG